MLPASYLSPISCETLLASRILVIEDSEFNHIIVKQIFESHGFTNLIYAHDGEEGLVKVFSSKPHLILLDLLMPKMDGYEFCAQLRRMPEYKDVPVLVLTAIDSPDEHTRIFALGATDLVTKPLQAGELIARTKVHLENTYLIDDLTQYRQRVTAELAQAREMQNDLMPNAALIEMCFKNYAIRVAYLFEPSSEMGGDMWGFMPISPHQLGIFMSDFSGHGITAALNNFRLHTLMREMPIQPDEKAGIYLSRLSMHLSVLLDRSQFATMFFAVADIITSSLYYATAAAPTALIWRHKDKHMEKLPTRGLPLSVMANTCYMTHVTRFEHGDILILYSDAFTETIWKEENFLTEEQLIFYLEDALQNGLETNATAIRNALIQYFMAYAKLPIMDDLTLSIYQRL